MGPSPAMVSLSPSCRAWFLAAALVVARGPLAAETLRIATYNVENYGPADRMTTEGYRRDYPKPEEEKRALRRVIAGLGADVLAIQEMGGQPCLDELRRDLRAEGVDYPYSAWTEGEDRVRHLALLSRRPFTAVRRHDDLEFSYLGGRARVKRGLLEAAVATSEGEVRIFVVHLKSRLTERPDDPGGAIRRAAEAAAVRRCVCERCPGPAARFVILGDFNDGRSSRPLQALERGGRGVIAVRLEAADSRGETWTEAWRRTSMRAPPISPTRQRFPGVMRRSSTDRSPEMSKSP